jgi:predicted DsbA family dithiol-disulfide isomerase
MLSIDVVSDVVCPWCYLGKARLEHALRIADDVPVTVRWHPFQLDPTIPPGGMPRDEYMRRKFGDLSRIEPVHQRLAEFGAAEGIAFHFDRIEVAANTLDAHRLIRWAGAAGRESEMVDRLFRLNFTESANIGDHAVLAAAAAELGMDADTVRARLATDEDRAAVQSEIASWQHAGVTGVPAFILNRRYAIMGAQEAETLAGAIRQAHAEGIVAAE